MPERVLQLFAGIAQLIGQDDRRHQKKPFVLNEADITFDLLHTGIDLGGG
ncbi:MAG: hypothetical protein WBX25_08705 [Rhodomicrobium sp.]